MSTFPPTGPTTFLKTIIAYLYEQYFDDQNLQAFVDSYNAIAQQYVTWDAYVELPVYTGLSGPLLDWVGTGLYGYSRPTIPSGFYNLRGPINTYGPNQMPINAIKRVNIGNNYFTTTDDVYQRCLTWHFYKGDGKYFTIPWLKRRVMRFLTGTNGTAPIISQTYAISVSIATPNVFINILSGRRQITGGAFPNAFAPNTKRPNELDSVLNPNHQSFPLAATFKAALEGGVLEFPFQYNPVVNIK